MSGDKTDSYYCHLCNMSHEVPLIGDKYTREKRVAWCEGCGGYHEQREGACRVFKKANPSGVKYETEGERLIQVLERIEQLLIAVEERAKSRTAVNDAIGISR